MKINRLHLYILMNILLMTFILSAAVFAPAVLTAQDRVVDNANLLSSAQKANLKESLDSIAETYDFDLVIVTERSIGRKTPMEYADDYFDYNGYGLGDDGLDGCLFLQVTGNRDYWFSTSGRGIGLLTSVDFTRLETRVLRYLGPGNNYQAYRTFIEEWESILSMEDRVRPVLTPEVQELYNDNLGIHETYDDNLGIQGIYNDSAEIQEAEEAYSDYNAETHDTYDDNAEIRETYEDSSGSSVHKYNFIDEIGWWWDDVIFAFEYGGDNDTVFDEYHGLFMVIAWLIALIAALIVVQIWKSAMNTARPQTQAAAYIISSSLYFKEKTDNFLYSTVTKTARPKADDSTHTSSSGNTHGGGGGKY